MTVVPGVVGGVVAERPGLQLLRHPSVARIGRYLRKWRNATLQGSRDGGLAPEPLLCWGVLPGL
jgi:hypothetical protein